MRNALLWILMVLATACGSSGGGNAPADSRIVVANRGDGTISVIDVQTLTVVDTVPLPADANPSVPGYAAYSEARDRLYVGDEANQRVVVFQGSDLSHVTDLPAIGDVFHIWQNDDQLWAVDRTNLGVAVFDLATDLRIAFVPIPNDLILAGGVPHDVVIDGSHAFVSVLGIDMAPDVVVRYSLATLQETGRVNVGEDPHLFLHPTTSRLYVACQDSDAVWVIDRDTLAEVAVIPADGGHGIWIPPHGQRLYVTNFAGHEPGPPAPLGPFALTTIDTATNRVVDRTHAPDSAPHNIASNASGSRIFVTHSNGGTNVTVYGTLSVNFGPREIARLEVGANPFGLCRIR